MRRLLVRAILIAVLTATGSHAADPILTPGLYRVEVRISLPNVQDVAEPMVLTRCLGSAELKSGQAFFVLSDNPLRTCDLLDYRVSGDEATYRILCPGPNRGSAVGVFETAGGAFRGTIEMNLGGKNMTMSERQVGRRLGGC